MNLDYKNSDDFDISYSGDKAKVNVIKVNDGMLHTEEFTHILKTENNILQPDIEEDILKIAVVQRYGSNTVANAFVHGFGLSVKDFIAPSSFAFPNGRRFQMGSLYGCMSFLSIDASDISDRMLADFLGMESSQIVTMHIQSVDQNEAIKTIKHTITELDRSKIKLSCSFTEGRMRHIQLSMVMQ